MPSDEAIAAVLMALAAGRGGSFCPSEAAGLAAEGRLVVTQKGLPVDPATARGPIRLQRG
jgi:hypothetical protein